MSERRDITGQRFGRLVALSREGSVKKGSQWRSQWKCKCDCGNEVILTLSSVAYGKTRSCGCFQQERRVEVNTTHGLYRTPIRRIWQHMLARCYCATDDAYSRYGGRGIRVCEFLRSSPRNLLDLIGPKPKGKSIDRINNNSHYSCGQCAECLRCGYPINIRWATPKQQARNQRTNRLFTYAGVTKCIGEWAEEAGIAYSAFIYRVNQGLDPFVTYRQKAKQ